ncbi:MAG TPA: protein translocase subunit SecF, partial [Anaerolineae bacterium]|nr:protein translocase subunit SecF [Anaerolineae bacterium]
GKRRWYFLISGAVILLGIAAMVYSTITYGTPVRLSVDFTGGSLFILHFQDEATEDGIRRVFEANGFDNPIIQQLGAHEDNTWQVRTSFATPEQVAKIQNQLDEEVAPIDRGMSSYDTVKPTVGGEVTKAAVLAVVMASVLVLLFIWYSFRRVPHAFRYGTCALVAMLHNVLVATGFFAVMGILKGWEIDALFLTAILTVVGFSVQDPIVVFDRIRENTFKRRGEPFEILVNRSILETIHRSLATQLNAMFVMAAILLFGGASMEKFISTWLVGMISGTYASLCIAVPLLVVWETGELGRLFRRKERATA